MGSGLSAVSFVCTFFLSVFILMPRIRCNVANLAIVSWLIGCNLVHAINSIIWSSNADVRGAVWCDIATKLLLGATVALPGAFLCISRRVELASSNRPILNDPKSQTHRLLLEFGLCYIVPIFYMALHLTVQDHRFDLAADYGCSASIHPSTIAQTIMWLPPVVLCLLSFVLSVLAIHRSFRYPIATFTHHLDSRSPLNYSLFIRRASLSLILTCALLITSLFSVFSVSTLVPWSSWSGVHADFAVVDIIQSSDDLRTIKLVWWGVPSISILYIVLSIAIGEETRDTIKWIRGWKGAMPKWRPRPLCLLPMHCTATESQPKMRLRPKLNLRAENLQSLDLKSGWDDMLKTSPKESSIFSSRKSPGSPRTVSPHRSETAAQSLHTRYSPSQGRAISPTSTSAASSPTVCGEDEAFIASTLDYLGSPVAKSLGISPSPTFLAPPPVVISPRRAASYQPSAPPSSTSPVSDHNTPPSPRRVPTDVDSVISVLEAYWPQPPLSPPTVVPRCRVKNSSSSPISESHPPRPTIAPLHLHSTPFENSTISSPSEISVPLHVRTKRTDVRALRRVFSNEKLANDSPRGVVYISVVKEVI